MPSANKAHLLLVHELPHESFCHIGLVQNGQYFFVGCFETLEHGSVDGIGASDGHCDIFLTVLQLLTKTVHVPVDGMLGTHIRCQLHSYILAT